MKNIYKSPLFTGLNPAETDSLLNDKSRVKQYPAGEIIAIQGDQYKNLLLIEQGTVKGEMTNPSGERIIIEEISAPRSIAPAFLYASDNTLPVDVITLTPTIIISIPRENFTTILQSNSQVLTNFMRSMSDRSKFLSERVQLLGFGSIKSKLANYLLKQIKRTNQSKFDLPHTHQELADMFGVTRPSLSRAIGQLAENGTISVQKKHISILNLNQLKQLAFS